MLSHDIILIKLKGKKAKEYVLNYMARQMRITFKEIPKEEIVLQEKGKKEIARHIFEQSLEQDFCSEIEFEVTNEEKLLKEKEAKKKAIEEAEKKATENAAKKAAEEAERKAAEEAAKKAAEEAERKTAENATKKERKTQQIKGKKKDVLIVINALKPRKISTRYVADALGIKYSEAKKELEELVTMGFAEREKLSRKNLKFYISKKGERKASKFKVDVSKIIKGEKQLEEYKKELEKAEKTNPEEASETKTVITEKPELEIAKKEEPETTEKPEPEIAKKEEPEATEKPEPEITKKEEPEATEKPEPEMAKKEEPEATEKTELEIAEKEEAERRQTEETKQILKLFYKTQSHNKVLREIFKQERFDVEYVRNKLLFEEKDILPEIIKKLNNEAISYDKLSETEGKYNVDPTWRVFALNRLGIERRFNVSPSQEVIQKLLAKGLIYKNAEGMYEIMK
ncbi:MAG: hypothetical protein BHW01_06220 [Clostridium sp. 27_14]|nr:MAG: hypothetical protein BHW01_06220 [Clostridium sp. 27_14]